MQNTLKVSAVALGLAAVAFASPALAVSTVYPYTAAPVGVTIVVEPNVSMWSNDANILLDMHGADGNNSATALSSLSVINNVDAKVEAKVTGTLPAPIVAGGGINFFIFGNTNSEAAAVAAITADAYNPAGAAAWNYSTLGATKTIISSTGVNTSIHNFPVVYAAAAPGELPLPNTYNLTVTYTISGNP